MQVIIVCCLSRFPYDQLITHTYRSRALLLYEKDRNPLLLLPPDSREWQHAFRLKSPISRPATLRKVPTSSIVVLSQGTLVGLTIRLVRVVGVGGLGDLGIANANLDALFSGSASLSVLQNGTGTHVLSIAADGRLGALGAELCGEACISNRFVLLDRSSERDADCLMSWGMNVRKA